MTDAQTTLVGKLLVAMPGMGDPRFEHSVVYISAHSEDGAMGLIVNKANAALDLKALLGHLDIPMGAFTPDVAIHFGGPVEPSRGFLLHSSDYIGDPDTLQIDERFAVTATVDAIKDLSLGLGPKTSLLALGYAGWSAGQLEAEMAENSWLTVQADPDILFRSAVEERLTAAGRQLGIDIDLLSTESGHA